MSSNRVTIRDIAKRLGVSPATVSTALTGRRNGVFVSEETKRRVWEVARELGYPLERLRARTPQLQRVALFCPPRPDSLLISGTVLELSHLLSQQGFRVLVHISHDRRQACEVVQHLYRRQEVDGAIFVGSRNHPEEVAVGEVPCVVVGEVPESVAVWRVGVDNEGGGRLVGEHLWALGHRRVGMVFSEANPLPSMKRLQGLRKVWQERGMDFPDEWVLRLSSDAESELMERLPPFVQPKRGKLAFTALFCYNDRLAGIAIKCLRRMGLRVPDDISVVGFDDAPYAELLDPPLTTVQQPFDQLGALAAQLLQERLSAPLEPPKVLVLPCRLVVRASTTSVSQ
ncbi:HTH-type transcriptional regulator DegA [bacterium HR17]|uniref:HTH-type transcriptional regulator DegA n=1 Tax=Candidatus Fervidibacter japonicus TaxID=2035412 RepID=A0A2H5XF45_9BACT|nr:HTH-type transcriptional regulator DegA [bacterium HR17]